MTKREVLEKYIGAMQKGDNVALADLFDDYGVLHDSSLIKSGADTLHLEGKMGVEMAVHHKFGMNRGPFKITSVEYQDPDSVRYFISYGDRVYPVCAILSKINDKGLIERLNIYPL